MDNVYIRVDDRLVHGQIITNWVKYLNIKYLIVVDDKTAQNNMLKQIMGFVIPKNIESCICSHEEFKQIDMKSNTLIIVKDPQGLNKLMENNIDVKEIIIGTVVEKKDAKKFTKNIFLTSEEKDIFDKISKKNLIKLQQLPDNKENIWGKL